VVASYELPVRSFEFGVWGLELSVMIVSRCSFFVGEWLILSTGVVGGRRED
jgi:hypothetical protein